MYDAKWSKNGKYFALVESSLVRVYDAVTKDCIKSFDVKYGFFVDFYDNDKKLLIGTWEKGYCVDIGALG